MARANRDDDGDTPGIVQVFNQPAQHPGGVSQQLVLTTPEQGALATGANMQFDRAAVMAIAEVDYGRQVAAAIRAVTKKKKAAQASLVAAEQAYDAGVATLAAPKTFLADALVVAKAIQKFQPDAAAVFDTGRPVEDDDESGDGYGTPSARRTDGKVSITVNLAARTYAASGTIAAGGRTVYVPRREYPFPTALGALADAVAAAQEQVNLHAQRLGELAAERAQIPEMIKEATADVAKAQLEKMAGGRGVLDALEKTIAQRGKRISLEKEDEGA